MPSNAQPSTAIHDRAQTLRARIPRTSYPRLRAFVSTARLAVAVTFAGFTSVFFLSPGVALVRELADPQLGGPGIPAHAKRLHRVLSPRIATWAEERVASGAAAEVQLHDVATTEWPMFTAVFYLLATEALQDEWNRDPQGTAPAVYAAEAIDAARDLVIDPRHHTWVRWHWGEDYLHVENVFFRGLLISGLTSHEALTRDGSSVPMLLDQIDTMSAELDASDHGLLNDYPLQCYPIDVVATIGWIQHADEVLGTDHSAFIARSVRGFIGPNADENGLVPFRVDLPHAYQTFGPARGIGNAWVSLFAPDLWPDHADRLYATHSELYWKDVGWAAGFREYLEGREDPWMFEIDAGPVVEEFGTSASAFGVAAARRNGRLDQAYTLSTQMSAVSWTLPDGTLLLPRLVSKATDAPYLGEAAIAYFLTVRPADGVPVVTGGHAPWLVWFAVAFYWGVGLLGLGVLGSSVRRWRAARR